MFSTSLPLSGVQCAHGAFKAAVTESFQLSALDIDWYCGHTITFTQLLQTYHTVFTSRSWSTLIPLPAIPSPLTFLPTAGIHLISPKSSLNVYSQLWWTPAQTPAVPRLSCPSLTTLLICPFPTSMQNVRASQHQDLNLSPAIDHTLSHDAQTLHKLLIMSQS